MLQPSSPRQAEGGGGVGVHTLSAETSAHICATRWQISPEIVQCCWAAVINIPSMNNSKRTDSSRERKKNKREKKEEESSKYKSVGIPKQDTLQALSQHTANYQWKACQQVTVQTLLGGFTVDHSTERCRWDGKKKPGFPIYLPEPHCCVLNTSHWIKLKWKPTVQTPFFPLRGRSDKSVRF